LSCDGLVVSSTKVRAELADGNVVAAARMLGRRYGLTGHVIRGDGRGKGLGFPTANIKPINGHKLMPGNGVYVVFAMINGREEIGMANVGVRPTFKDDADTLLEVHFLDLEQDLYDKEIRIVFWHFLRTEQKFASKEALLEQLERDQQQTRELQTTFHQRSDI
jgi:riboflavin kinase/FMN adenylyltransferase